MTATQTSEQRVAAFFDGQNLFYAAKAAFGYQWPNYDPLRLADAVCVRHGWTLVQTNFYTGLPSGEDNPFWNHFWTAKLAQMGRVGVRTFSRHLKYRNHVVRRRCDAVDLDRWWAGRDTRLRRA